jgi:hypothetical protein
VSDETQKDKENLVGIFLHGKRLQFKLIFQKFPYKMSGQICMGKMNKSSTKIDFIQKLRKILPNRNKLFKDDYSIFPTSINMSQNVNEVLRFLTSNMVKIVILTHSQVIFFKVKMQSAPFFQECLSHYSTFS